MLNYRKSIFYFITNSCCNSYGALNVVLYPNYYYQLNILSDIRWVTPRKNRFLEEIFWQQNE